MITEPAGSTVSAMATSPADRLSAARYYAVSEDRAVRAAARLAAAREANQRRRSAVLAQRRLDRDRQQQHDIDRLRPPSATLGRDESPAG